MRRRLVLAGRIALGIGFSAGFLYLAARGLDWGNVGANLAGLSVPNLLLAITVFMAASYVRALRWKILLPDEQVSTGRLFVIQNEGLGLNNLLPVRVAAEITQIAVLTLRDGVDRSTALATIGMERVVDVASSTLILAVAFFLVPELKSFTVYVWGAIAVTFLILALVRLFTWSSQYLAFIRRISFLASFAEALRHVERRRVRLLASFLVSVGYWALIGTTAWLLATAVDLPMSPLTATLVIMGAILFSSAVPAAPFAIGTLEWAVVYLLEIFGIPHDAGFGYALLVHAVFFLPQTIIAAIYLPREGLLSLRRGSRPAPHSERTV